MLNVKESVFVNTLSIMAVLLVCIVTVFSFVLSFEALMELATEGGKTGVLSWLWPMIIDFPIIVFSIVALLATFLSKRYATWTFRGMVILCTLATVGFNYVHASEDTVSKMVAISAPIMYFLSFEVLMWLVAVISERSIAVTTLDSIRQTIRERQKQLDAIVQRKQETAAELDARIERLQNRATQLQSDIARQETTPEIDERRQRLFKLVSGGETNKTRLSELLDVSRSTVYKDIEALKETGVLHENGNGLEVMTR